MADHWGSSIVHNSEGGTASVPDASLSLRRWLLCGLFGWLLFSILAVVVRGVRWDETYEWAQILVGDVVYPDHHPHDLYVRRIFTAQHFVSALLLKMTSSAWVVCAFRNVLFLFLGIAPIFLLTSMLSRKPLLGHAAVVLALQNVLVTFETTYPMRVWPHSFSNGPIGSGWALLSLFFLLAGYWRVGALTLGLMPAIHLGQMPALLLIALCYFTIQWRAGMRPELTAALPYALAGLGVCLGIFLVVRALSVEPAVEGAYFSSADPLVIWQNYKEVWYHTTLHGGLNGFLYSHTALAMAVLLGGGAAAHRVRREGRGDPFVWLFAFCLVTAVTVLSIMATHSVLGTNTPYLLIAWVPYRLANLVPPLLLAMAIGVLSLEGREGRSSPRGVYWLIGGTIAGGIVASALHLLIGDALYTRYLESSEWIVFVLFGAAAGRTSQNLRGPTRASWAWHAAGAVLLTLFLVLHQFGFACIVFGLAINSILTRFQASTQFETRPSGAAQAVVAVLCVLALVQVLVTQHRGQDGLPLKGFDVRLERSAFDVGLERVLAARGETQAMLVADNFAPFLQARTGHPVMAHWMSGSYAMYTPGFAPMLQKIFRDIYGISYGESVEGDVPQQPEVWRAAWSERSSAQWQDLGREYDFKYVVAPADLEVDLIGVYEKDDQVLYEIPSRPRP